VTRGGFKFDGVMVKSLRLGVTFAQVFFISASLVLTLQDFTNGDAFYDASIENGPLNFHDALYFIAVTMSTVGYGDMYPQTSLSRFVMLSVLFVAILVIPPQVSALVETVKDRAKFQDAYVERRKYTHIVLVGSFSSSKLVEVVHELFNENEKRGDSHRLGVVVLSPREPDEKTIALLSKRRFRDLITYIKGSPISPIYLKKAKITTAKLIFLFTDAEGSNSDKESILTAIAIRRYLGNRMTYQKEHRKQCLGTGLRDLRFTTPTREIETKEDPAASLTVKAMTPMTHSPSIVPRADTSTNLRDIFLEPKGSENSSARKLTVDVQQNTKYSQFLERNSVLYSSESMCEDQTKPKMVAQIYSEQAAKMLKGCGVEYVLNINEIRMALLAFGTLCQGFITLVRILVHSANDFGKLFNKVKDHDNWFYDYCAGGCYEVFCIEKPSDKCWDTLSFKDVASYVFHESHIILVGVLVDDWAVLFPGKNFRFCEAENHCRVIKLFVLATSLKKAKAAVNHVKPQQAFHAGTLNSINPCTSGPSSPSSSGFPSINQLTKRSTRSVWEATPNRKKVPLKSLLLKSSYKGYGRKDSGFIGEENGYERLDFIPETEQRKDRSNSVSVDCEPHRRKLSENYAFTPREDMKYLQSYFQSFCSQLATGISTQSEAVDVLKAGLETLHTALQTAILPNHTMPHDLHGHIVMIGNLTSAELFILSIRRVSDFPVLVIHEQETSFLKLLDDLKAASPDNPECTQNVFYIKGSSALENDLEQSNIHQASAVVMLGTEENQYEISEDMETLLKTFELELYLRDKFYDMLVIVELSSEQSTFFMGQGGGSTTHESFDLMDPEDLVSWPLFAAGRVFHQSTLSLLTMRLYYSPEELSFWHAVLHIEGYKTSDDSKDNGPFKDKSSFPRTGNGFFCGVMDQLEMIQGYVGKKYSQLFDHLLQNNALALGLYRPADCKGSQLPYIHVNPDPDTLLLGNDKIFVILSPDYSDHAARFESPFSAGVQEMEA